MPCPQDEWCVHHPRGERRTLPLLSLLILLCICYAGENCIRGKQHSLIKQPEQILLSMPNLFAFYLHLCSARELLQILTLSHFSVTAPLFHRKANCSPQNSSL